MELWQLQSSEKVTEKLRYSLDGGWVVGNISREMELDFCLQMVLQDTRSGLQRGGDGEGSWRNPSSQGEEGERLTGHPKEQERESSVAFHGLDALIPGMQLQMLHLVQMQASFTDTRIIFFVNIDCSVPLASATSFPDGTPGCCTPSCSF